MTAVRRLLCAAALTSTGLLAGCAGSSRPGSTASVLPTTVPKTVTVRAGQVPGLGSVLTDGDGRTLYIFPPDGGGVTCTGPCIGTWPPLSITAGDTPRAGAGVSGSELGVRHDPATGSSVVTYAGHPLYRYAGDLHSGTANGQTLFLNGGPWYVIQPSGVVETQPAADT